jgi:hypothetical protein
MDSEGIIMKPNWENKSYFSEPWKEYDNDTKESSSVGKQEKKLRI